EDDPLRAMDTLEGMLNVPARYLGMEDTAQRVWDRAVYSRYLGEIAARLARSSVRMGPSGLVRNLSQYPWTRSMLQVATMYHKLVSPRTGRYREANAVLMAGMVESASELMERALSEPERLILHEDLVPPEIINAMGLNSWCLEFVGFLVPMLIPSMAEKYIDACENGGIPPDVCSLPKEMMGMTLSGHIPKSAGIVTSNSPCDGGMSSYSLMERELKVPVFRMDVPYNFKSDRAARYFVGELERLIAWLEEKTFARMDWDRLTEICAERNRMLEAELELWDLQKTRPAPLGGEPMYLSHLWCYTVAPGRPSSTKLFERLTALARKNLEAGKGAIPEERYRILLWGPFPAHLYNLFAWVERVYGGILILDSLSFNRLPFIRTDNREDMLADLGRTIMAGPMARHSRGPSENYFEDMFHMVENFNIDMIWLAGHVGCKNAQALNGMLREKCRERGIPLFPMEFDLSDPRVVSGKDIKGQVEHFMENVMHAKRLDR
ncbi:MAG: 2-hydroxyacyl-CoA dehydratase family protein, partial [Pseudomonadota bacterium]